MFNQPERMPRTDEAEAWFTAVYAAVQEIPKGKVTSYGHIARLLGHRRLRLMLHILKTNSFNPQPSAPGKHRRRVSNASSFLTHNSDK